MANKHEFLLESFKQNIQLTDTQKKKKKYIYIHSQCLVSFGTDHLLLKMIPLSFCAVSLCLAGTFWLKQ